mmetsp:Transcript_10592/g.26943  ORF Transcript_10592/g.26943 Transcript_10592/m.26943 type:complete len:249 (-) Transcript_10592:22-768(-)
MKGACYTAGREDLRGLFSRADRDHNGVITLPEFITSCRKDMRLSKQVACDGSLREMFEALDEDGSGAITLGELHSFLNRGRENEQSYIDVMRKKAARMHRNFAISLRRCGKTLPEIQRLFNKFDRDGNSFVSFHEYESAVRFDLKLSKWDVSDSDLKVLWQYLDADGSGYLDVHEFVNFIKQVKALDGRRSTVSAAPTSSQYTQRWQKWLSSESRGTSSAFARVGRSVPANNRLLLTSRVEMGFAGAR